jgi:hypothetical protein
MQLPGLMAMLRRILVEGESKSLLEQDVAEEDEAVEDVVQEGRKRKRLPMNLRLRKLRRQERLLWMWLKRL